MQELTSMNVAAEIASLRAVRDGLTKAIEAMEQRFHFGECEECGGRIAATDHRRAYCSYECQRRVQNRRQYAKKKAGA